MDDLTIKPIKLKDGSEIPTGAQISWSKGQAAVTWSQDGEVRTGRISALRAADVLGIEKPSDAQVSKWVIDSVCESILGAEVEPDGFDPQGSPSWLLAMGLI
jgi:hypothetical protein